MKQAVAAREMPEAAAGLARRVTSVVVVML